MSEQLEIKVEGMSCEGCAQAVRNAVLNNVEGVEEVEVNLEGGRARITHGGDARTAEQAVSAISEAGYDAKV